MMLGGTDAGRCMVILVSSSTYLTTMLQASSPAFGSLCVNGVKVHVGFCADEEWQSDGKEPGQIKGGAYGLEFAAMGRNGVNLQQGLPIATTSPGSSLPPKREERARFTASPWLKAGLSRTLWNGTSHGLFYLLLSLSNQDGEHLLCLNQQERDRGSVVVHV